MKIKNEAGVTGMDFASGLMIFMISSAVVVSMYYQIYITTAQIKIHQYAVGCITDIFEKIDLESYDSINDEKVKSLIEESGMNDYFNEENDSSVDCNIESYKNQANVEQDLVKKVNITVVYTVGESKMTLPLSKIKIRE